MKILLIQPSEFYTTEITKTYQSHGYLKILKPAGRYFHRVSCLPPIGLLYLATNLKNHGHEVKILDAWTLQLTNGEVVQEAKSFTPDLIGISFYSWYCHQVYTLTDQLKQVLNIPILAGGPHPTALPEKVIQEYPNIDYLLTGWCDYSIINFIDYLEKKINPSEVPGIYYRHNGKFLSQNYDELPDNIDMISFPDRNIIKDMYDNNLYFNIISPGKKMDAIITSRNCPYSCNFCFNLTGHKFLYHSPEYVIDEIDILNKRGIDAIEIMDDNFTVNRERVKSILNKIIERNYNIQFRIRCRVDSVDEKLIKHLKQAGVKTISYGMESGSDKVLKLMNKQTSTSQIEEACLLAKKEGIFVTGNWLIGYPGEDKNDLQKTLSLIKKILPTSINLGFLVPFPGTAIYKQSKENGSLVGDWGPRELKQPFIKTDGWQELPTFESRLEYLDKLMWNLRMNPKYIYQIVKIMIKQRNLNLVIFGIKYLAFRSSKIFRYH